VVAVAIVLAAGCTGGADGSAASTTSAASATSAAPTTSTTTTGDDAVLAGYRAFWAAHLRAADPMNPEHPDLAATATGEQLGQVKRAFLFRLSGGEVIRGPIEPRPHIEGAVQASTATVLDCSIDNSHIFDAATGAQKDKPGTFTHEMRADMVLVENVWKVSAVHHLRDGCTPS
jgi:hypothetical protein